MHPRLFLWYARSQGLYLVVAWLLIYVVFEALDIYANFWLSFLTDDPRLLGASGNTSSFAPASTAPYPNASAAATIYSSTSAAAPRTPAAPSEANWTMATSTASRVSSDATATSEAPSLRSLQFYYLRAISWIVLVGAVLFLFHSLLFVVGCFLSSRAIHAKVMGIVEIVETLVYS